MLFLGVPLGKSKTKYVIQPFLLLLLFRQNFLVHPMSVDTRQVVYIVYIFLHGENKFFFKIIKNKQRTIYFFSKTYTILHYILYTIINIYIYVYLQYSILNNILCIPISNWKNNYRLTIQLQYSKDLLVAVEQITK